MMSLSNRYDDAMNIHFVDLSISFNTILSAVSLSIELEITACLLWVRTEDIVELGPPQLIEELPSETSIMAPRAFNAIGHLHSHSFRYACCALPQFGVRRRPPVCPRIFATAKLLLWGSDCGPQYLNYCSRIRSDMVHRLVYLLDIFDRIS
jgi:hypothetical protein